MVRRFLDWHRANPRKLAGTEEAFRIQLGRVEITGRVDRLEADEHGRAVIVDLKTGTGKPADDELDRHPQLGVYQLAVLLGAFERFGLIEPGGAELVQVGKAALTARARVQRQRELAADPEPDWPRERWSRRWRRAWRVLSSTRRSTRAAGPARWPRAAPCTTAAAR